MDGPGRARPHTFGFVELQGCEKLPQRAMFVYYFERPSVERSIYSHVKRQL